MRAVVQRVSEASVTVGDKTAGQIQRGLLVLLGVAVDDQESDLKYLIKKIVNLRIFEDDAGKMNLALSEVGGKMLVVSQFTLLGDVRRGNRPSFIQAAEPKLAQRLYHEFVDEVRALGISVETGIFQADMQVQLINDGPVTIILDSRWK